MNVYEELQQIKEIDVKFYNEFENWLLNKISAKYIEIRLNEIENMFNQDIEKVKNLEDINSVKIKYLGKKGILTLFQKEIYSK